MTDRRAWSTTTHDRSVDVDRDHLSHIRARPGEYAPGGFPHLMFDVVRRGWTEHVVPVTVK